MHKVGIYFDKKYLLLIQTIVEFSSFYSVIQLVQVVYNQRSGPACKQQWEKVKYKERNALLTFKQTCHCRND
jgi:hypothetical protein